MLWDNYAVLAPHHRQELRNIGMQLTKISCETLLESSNHFKKLKNKSNLFGTATVVFLWSSSQSPSVGPWTMCSRSQDSLKNRYQKRIVLVLSFVKFIHFSYRLFPSTSSKCKPRFHSSRTGCVIAKTNLECTFAAQQALKHEEFKGHNKPDVHCTNSNIQCRTKPKPVIT